MRQPSVVVGGLVLGVDRQDRGEHFLRVTLNRESFVHVALGFHTRKDRPLRAGTVRRG